MLLAAQFICTFCTALFAGAALYINVAEHPARMGFETGLALKQWAPSYQRATWLQAPLALLGSAAGLTAWLLGASVVWLYAALLIGAVVPFTFIAVMRINKKLLAPDRDPASAETRSLLEKWGRLHAVRTGLSLVATALCIWLLVRV